MGMGNKIVQTVGSLAGAMLLALGLWSDPVMADAAASAETDEHQIAPDPVEVEGPAFAIGDRLSIRVFERYGSENGTTVLSSLMEFPEISGEYVVAESGTIFLPLVGEIKVAGETHATLREAAAAQFSRLGDGEIVLMVKILEREPIYVTGAVANPGAYEHVPGMTILHAVTLAGGLPGSGADAWRVFDIGRERERLRQSEITLGRLYAKNAILEAEVTAREPVAPDTLLTLVGRSQANELLAEAQALRSLQRKSISIEDAGQAEVVAALEREAEALREALAEAEVTAAERAERLESLSQLQDRGLASNERHNNAGDSLVYARERWNELRMSLARVERALAEVQRDRRKLMVEDHLVRESERVELRAEIAGLQSAQYMIRQTLFGSADPSMLVDRDAVEMVVLRRGRDGLQEVEVDEWATLVPGDLVEVRSRADGNPIEANRSTMGPMPASQTW